ncbi:hypothetical protein AMTRI_Chr02g265720 [Amborella trichopoda]|uniref:bifunctional TENA-E protein n=1 Tax=Amborella trichopoda TaxID=13333 RepID=UPI0005D43434|nr:bifunctional TENA-E protein [Amborella trichopoda]|eukprot:XP_011621896.1 bifunctional TENA-E protein [Amborella trichopoda]
MEGRRSSDEGEERGSLGFTDIWMREKHHLLYSKATHHPFILSISNGTLHISSFKRWLGQDYLFVRQFIPFVASILIKSWKEAVDNSDMDLILSGLASLNDEISWFKKEASKWDIVLSDIIPQESNQDYSRFLESLTNSEIDYPVVLTALWAIEVVYQESFSLCLKDDSKTPPELLEACHRWGNEEFKQYCCLLQRTTDRYLEKAPINVVAKAEEVFVRVLENEVKFWNMSYGEQQT